MHSDESRLDAVDGGPRKSHLELDEAFRDCDGNSDGRIDFAEFACLVATMRRRMSHAHVLSGFRVIDRDDDGAIDFREFLSWWRARGD